MPIKYPPECVTDADKSEFVRIAGRKLHESSITGQEETEMQAKLGIELMEIKARYKKTKDYNPGSTNIRPDGVIFPAGVNSDEEKLKFLWQAEEELRIARNQHAAGYRAGVVTRAARVAYERVFNARSKRVHEQIGMINHAARSSTRFDPDLADLEVAVAPIE